MDGLRDLAVALVAVVYGLHHWGINWRAGLCGFALLFVLSGHLSWTPSVAALNSVRSHPLVR